MADPDQPQRRQHRTAPGRLKALLRPTPLVCPPSQVGLAGPLDVLHGPSALVCPAPRSREPRGQIGPQPVRGLWAQRTPAFPQPPRDVTAVPPTQAGARHPAGLTALGARQAGPPRAEQMGAPPASPRLGAPAPRRVATSGPWRPPRPTAEPERRRPRPGLAGPRGAGPSVRPSHATAPAPVERREGGAVGADAKRQDSERPSSGRATGRSATQHTTAEGPCDGLGGPGDGACPAAASPCRPPRDRGAMRGRGPGVHLLAPACH
jgi:hypothetical protein